MFLGHNPSTDQRLYFDLSDSCLCVYNQHGHARLTHLEGAAYLMFILWVLKPRRGSSTKLVARSSVSHSSFTLILVHPSMASHYQHATITGWMLHYHNSKLQLSLLNHSYTTQVALRLAGVTLQPNPACKRSLSRA